MRPTRPRSYMPQLNRHVVAKGLQLRNFLISTAACCPSRTILMTGRYTHNNNVTSNIEPHGGTRGTGTLRYSHVLCYSACGERVNGKGLGIGHMCGHADMGRHPNTNNSFQAHLQNTAA